MIGRKRQVTKGFAQGAVRMGEGLRIPRISSAPKSGYAAELLKPSGTEYRPAYSVHRGPNGGVVHRVWSSKAARTLHLMSTLELHCWLEAEFLEETTDIREQFAFCTAGEFQSIARSLCFRP